MTGPPSGARPELTRSARRRTEAQRVTDGAPQEGVAIFRPAEKAVLVALHRDGVTSAEVDASLDELQLLVDTAGSESVARLVQKRGTPDIATFIGRGKVAELKGLASDLGADAAVFDDELSPAQQRNLEERLGVKVLDRTIVILDIFAQHAKSREGRAQVELAQLQYLLPRLRGWGDSMSRQAGGRVAGGEGIGSRGPGETKIELDRRRINQRIAKLRRDIKGMKSTRDTKRSSRKAGNVSSVAIVGYTNAGKSSLLNRLTGAGVLVQDQLFATLDPTVRRAETSDGRTYTLADTVGFVRQLPHQLIEAFRSTLEEAADADLLLHVVDGAHVDPEGQISAVREVLADVEAEAVKELIVVNKADLADPEVLARLQRHHAHVVVVSARTGQGFPELLRIIEAELPRPEIRVEVLLPYDRGDLVNRLHTEGDVLAEEHTATGTRVEAKVERDLHGALGEFAC